MHMSGLSPSEILFHLNWGMPLALVIFLTYKENINVQQDTEQLNTNVACMVRIYY